MNVISFATNNGGTLMFRQEAYDKNVIVRKSDDFGREVSHYTIPCTDAVMLWNLYRYIKENDIQNDFINPHGKNKE